MKTFDEMISVMKAHRQGCLIESCRLGTEDWEQDDCPVWNWQDMDYRISERKDFPTSWYDWSVNFQTKTDIQFYHMGTIEHTEAFMALGRLLQLRDYWWQHILCGWHPGEQEVAYFNVTLCDCPAVLVDRVNDLLSFPTLSIANKFLNMYKPTIITASQLFF